jgi:KRAB domain-containing zinc finger protein
MEQHHHHAGVMRCECPTCHKTYFDKLGLEYHIRADHTDDRPFECHDCGQAITIPSSLNIYLRADEDSWSYKCTIVNCDFPV